jgi:hypothetical protein
LAKSAPVVSLKAQLADDAGLNTASAAKKFASEICIGKAPLIQQPGRVHIS